MTGTPADSDLFLLPLQTSHHTWAHASVHSEPLSLSHSYTELGLLQHNLAPGLSHGDAEPTIGNATQVSDLSYLDYHTEAVFDNFLKTFGSLETAVKIKSLDMDFKSISRLLIFTAAY
jgi:hypothetical protein